MKTPRHVWVVGLASLLWHAGGAYDYVMAKTMNAGYIAAVPETIRADFVAYLQKYPFWASVAWALGVWGAVLGSVLILLRSRFAASAFMVSLIAFIANTAYTFIAPNGLVGTVGPGALLFTGVIFLVLVAVTYYAMRQARAGVLR